MMREICHDGEVRESVQPLVAVGWSSAADSGKAGAAVGFMAAAGLGAGRVPGWALAFCAGRHDPKTFLAALRQGLGNIPVAGGAAAGCMANDLLGDTGFECAAAVFAADLPRPRFVLETGLDCDEQEAGFRLGRRLKKLGLSAEVTLLFYDLLRTPGPPPNLHVGSLLLDGVHAALDGAAPTLIGGGTIADHHFQDSYIFDGLGVRRHAALAVTLPPGIRARTVISHGCAPVSGFYEITRANGTEILELNNRPALEALASLGLKPAMLPLHVGLGRKIGDPYGPDREASFVNRLIISVDPAARSVTLFEADFARGDWVQVMARSNAGMLSATSRAADRLLQETGPGRPLLALYADCAGRAASFCGSDAEEAAIVQASLRESVPLLGFYAGVEVAPLMGRSRPLNRAGALTLLSLHQDRQPR